MIWGSYFLCVGQDGVQGDPATGTERPSETNASRGQGWRLRAACRVAGDPPPLDLIKDQLALFFPFDDPPFASGASPRVRAAIRAAKAVCREECPVRHECALFARETRQLEGVWGGMYGDELRTWVRGNKRRVNAREDD